MTCASRHIAAIVLLGIALALHAAQPSRKQAGQAAEDVKTLKQRIEREQKQLTQDAQKRDRMNRDLRDAERSAASARAGLRDLRNQRAERAATRQKLIDQRSTKETEREQHRRELADQLRSAYFMGRNEPLQLLLNQRSTADVSRTLTYYGYFGRLRARQIAELNQDVADIKELTAKIEAEDAELAKLEQQQKARSGELDAAVQQRGQVLASLDQTSRSRAAQLAQLKAELQQKEDLLKRLSRQSKSVPFDPNAPFAKQRNGLDWPVAGRIDVDYGEPTPGGLPSQGIEIDAARGTDVHAVHDGQVVFADYLAAAGMGYMIIIDHGGGYLSLYANNDQLFREKDARVKAGEVIASAGDSGGRKTPGLHFEIRRGGAPVDPHTWLRSKVPPSK
jgi:septal ring factor EnvC (AmiA/AmiB activator)